MGGRGAGPGRDRQDGLLGQFLAEAKGAGASPRPASEERTAPGSRPSHADAAGERAVTVLRGSGEESESLLDYGVLGQLARSAGPAGAALLAVTERSSAPEPILAGTCLLELLGELESAGPVVLVVDDLHWADRPSVRALVFAVRRLVADQVLVVLATRDDVSTELPESLRRVVSGHHGDVVRLAGLDEGDLRELAERLGIAALPARAARRLRDGTRGNPLHARAVLDEVAGLDEAPDGWGHQRRPLRRRGRSAGWSVTATRRALTTPAGSSTPPPSWGCARRCRSRRASARSAIRCRPSTRPWPAAC